MRLAGIDVGAYNHILIQSAPPFKLSNAKRLFKKGFILLGSYDKMRGSLRALSGFLVLTNLGTALVSVQSDVRIWIVEVSYSHHNSS